MRSASRSRKSLKSWVFWTAVSQMIEGPGQWEIFHRYRVAPALEGFVQDVQFDALVGFPDHVGGDGKAGPHEDGIRCRGPGGGQNEQNRDQPRIGSQLGRHR